ncbi:MAG: helix-turn-helix domain-containing protein [Oscillospiraceae bacterium]|nr:helix-turn-helix domain-containing protein [Oscillospiraceae bacterium]
MAKLTDKQKQKIIADYVQTQNKKKTAEMNGVSRPTVDKIIVEASESGLYKKLHRKKEENTESVLQYIEQQGDNVKTLIGKYIGELQDDDKIAKASVREIATALGIVIDKFALHIEARDKRNEGTTVKIDWSRDKK